MKVILTTLLLLMGFALQAQDSLSIQSDTVTLQKSDSLIALAKSQLGIPYKWATSKPGVSFDCSGFTYFVYDSMGVAASRSSKAYANLGQEVALDSCRAGDCIIFAGTQAGSRTVGHVGIVISNDENGLQFIHCSSSKKHFGVVVTDFHNSGYPRRFLQVRRLL